MSPVLLSVQPCQIRHGSNEINNSRRDRAAIYLHDQINRRVTSSEKAHADQLTSQGSCACTRAESYQKDIGMAVLGYILHLSCCGGRAWQSRGHISLSSDTHTLTNRAPGPPRGTHICLPVCRAFERVTTQTFQPLFERRFVFYLYKRLNTRARISRASAPAASSGC